MNWILFIGDFQDLEDGCLDSVKEALDDGKNVCLGVRESENNPYSVVQRKALLLDMFFTESQQGRIKLLTLPNVTEVYQQSPKCVILDPERVIDIHCDTGITDEGASALLNVPAMKEAMDEVLKKAVKDNAPKKGSTPITDEELKEILGG